MITVAHIFKLLLFQHSVTEEGLAKHIKTNQQSKARLELKLLGKQKDIRAILLDKVLIQHEMRLLQNAQTSFTGAWQPFLMSFTSFFLFLFESFLYMRLFILYSWLSYEKGTVFEYLLCVLYYFSTLFSYSSIFFYMYDTYFFYLRFFFLRYPRQGLPVALPTEYQSLQQSPNSGQILLFFCKCCLRPFL